LTISVSKTPVITSKDARIPVDFNNPVLKYFLAPPSLETNEGRKPEVKVDNETGDIAEKTGGARELRNDFSAVVYNTPSRLAIQYPPAFNGVILIIRFNPYDSLLTPPDIFSLTIRELRPDWEVGKSDIAILET